MLQSFSRILFVFLVLLLLQLCAVTSNCVSDRFCYDEICHLLDIGIKERIDTLIVNSVSVSKVYISRNFIDHIRIDNVTYGSAVIESIISHTPFDLSIIDTFFNDHPNPSLLDYKTLVAKYTRINSSFDVFEAVGNHGQVVVVLNHKNNTSNVSNESSIFSGMFPRCTSNFL